MARIGTAVLFLVLAVSPTSLAVGWADYEVEIDPGFVVVRANSLDVMVSRPGGEIILPTSEHQNVGPLSGYAVTPTHILTRHYGRRSRNLFAGDTFEEVDPMRLYFFVTRKSDAGVTGPLSEQEFLNDPVVRAAGTVRWAEPRHPATGVICSIAVCVLLALLCAPILWLRRRSRTPTRQ